MFIHHSEHYTAPHRHELVSEARECEAEAAYAAAWEAAHDAPTCSLCDAVGHGYPGGGPCPLEVNERARYEDDQDELRALALGVSFADYALA